jgi:glycosyltransferase involved in cell wall biosynthesis
MGGLKRKVFETIERMVCRLSTHVQPDSYGNLNFCREQGLYDDRKSCVIWNGSAKGLDLTAFDITKKGIYAEEIKAKYNIPAGVPVVGFVGRLGREKGCHELLKAFQNVKKEFPSAKLLFVGPIEKKETMDSEILEYFENSEDVIKTDRVSNVEKYTSAMDVYVLPSYREGFGMGVVEASAMGVPVVVTQYPGPSSAMEEGVSGYSVPVKDVELLTKYILDFLRNPEEAERIGQQGRKWVEERFDQKIFIEKYMANRMDLLNYSGK